MKLKESKVIEIMKDKMERFNQDDELRLAAYNRELNIYAHEMELEESYQNGKAEGKKSKNYTIKYNFSMGKEDLKEIMEESFLIYFKRKEHNCILKNKSRIK